jgi:hypothetical protein
MLIKIYESCVWIKNITIANVLCFMAVVICTGVNAQSAADTISLVVSGQGQNPQDARLAALRSAVEQACGVFISSNTEIFNDSLVRDEIVSVSSGNILHYDIISEVQLPSGTTTSVLKALVSISKLTSYVESHGMQAEFNGGLFGMTIKLQKLNEQNEVLVIKDLCQTLKRLADVAFDYSLQVDEPKVIEGELDQWKLKFNVSISSNSNMLTLSEFLTKGLQGISMTAIEEESYTKLGKPFYKLSFGNNHYALRNCGSLGLLQDLCWYMHFQRVNFIISSGLNNYSPYDISGYESHYINALDKYFKCVHFKHGTEFDSEWTPIKGSRPQYSESDYLAPVPIGDFSSYPWSTYSSTKQYIAIINSSRRRNDFRDCIVDSNTLFITQRSIETGYIGATYLDGEYLEINAIPVNKQFAKFSLHVRFSTDELSKINAFTIKSNALSNVAN